MLEQIPRMFAETKVLDSCFGGAVEAAIEVCRACWAPAWLPTSGHFLCVPFRRLLICTGMRMLQTGSAVHCMHRLSESHLSLQSSQLVSGFVCSCCDVCLCEIPKSSCCALAYT